MIVYLIHCALGSLNTISSLPSANVPAPLVFAVTSRTESVNLGRADGRAKVAGVIVCVSGALFMALYKGPALLGDGFSDFNLEGMAIAGKPAPEPVGWLATAMLDLGIDLWQIGVFCLIANTMCLAVYIAYQVT